MLRWPVVLALTLGAGACERTAPPEPLRGELPEGVVARVGEEQVHVETVRRIVQAQRVAPRDALDRALADAVLAQGFRAKPDAAPVIAAAERGSLARIVLQELNRESRAAGPPTDAEVDAVVDRRWYDLARPSSVRTTHALIMAKEPAERERAAALVKELAKGLRGAKDADEFEARAKAFDAKGLELKVERLPPVAADGRVIPDAPPPPGEAPVRLELPFARAANELTRVGEQSAPVETTHGYHVIRAEEHRPGMSLPAEELRKRVTPEIYAERARELERRLLDRLITEHAVRVDRAADDLTSRVRVAP